MLQTIRRYIDEMPKKTFEEHYQDYVRSIQDAIIEYKLHDIESAYSAIEDSEKLLKGINTLTEELKEL